MAHQPSLVPGAMLKHVCSGEVAAAPGSIGTGSNGAGCATVGTCTGGAPAGSTCCTLAGTRAGCELWALVPACSEPLVLALLLVVIVAAETPIVADMFGSGVHSHVSGGQTILAQLVTHQTSVISFVRLLQLGRSSDAASLGVRGSALLRMGGLALPAPGIGLPTMLWHSHFVGGQKAPASLAHSIPHHSSLISLEMLTQELSKVNVKLSE